jgi:hypothetical protein
MKVFSFFKKKRPGVKPAPIKRETRSGQPEPVPPKVEKKGKSLKTLGRGRFFRRVRFMRWRIPWWLRLIKWREIPGWGKLLIVLGAVGVGLAIWFAVQSSLALPPEYRLSVTTEPAGGGQISLSSSYDDFSEGFQVNLTATPSVEYEFVSWSGDASGVSPAVTITMGSDKEVTANFVAIFQEIRFIMPTGISGSAVVYKNVLEWGEIIEGFVELSGEFRGQDWSFDWTFEIIGPEGRKIDYWEGYWVKDNHHDVITVCLTKTF